MLWRRGVYWLGLILNLTVWSLLHFFFAKVDDVFDNGITIYNGRVFICGQIFLFLIVQLIRAASCIPTFLEAVGIVS